MKGWLHLPSLCRQGMARSFVSQQRKDCFAVVRFEFSRKQTAPCCGGDLTPESLFSKVGKQKCSKEGSSRNYPPHHHPHPLTPVNDPTHTPPPHTRMHACRERLWGQSWKERTCPQPTSMFGVDVRSTVTSDSALGDSDNVEVL